MLLPQIGEAELCVNSPDQEAGVETAKHSRPAQILPGGLVAVSIDHHFPKVTGPLQISTIPGPETGGKPQSSQSFK